MKIKYIVGGIICFLLLIFNVSSLTIEIKEQSCSSIYNENLLYVGGCGPGNYSRMQDAINNSMDGDTIFVFSISSPYNENIVVNKSINLIGQNKETTIINGNNRDDVIKIHSMNVFISGFSIQTDDFSSGYCGIIINANNTIIKDNIILNNYFGVYIYQSCENQVVNNKFINNENGLRLYSSGNTIKNNSFFNDGISVATGGNLIGNNTVNFKPIVYLENKKDKIITDEVGQLILFNCNNMTIKNLSIRKTYTGIYLYNCSNCLVTNNYVFESKSGMIISYSNHNNISFNSLYKNKNNGIVLYRSNNNKIIHNWCTKHIMGEYYCRGIYLSGCDFNQISGNLLRYNGIGLVFSHCFDNVISENIIELNYYIGIKLEYESENNSITRNSIRNNKRGMFLEDVSFNYITQNNFIGNEKDLELDIVQMYKLNLRRLPKINKNFWERTRILPKCIPGEFTFVYMDVPYGGYITLNWLYFDWNPAKEINEI